VGLFVPFQLFIKNVEMHSIAKHKVFLGHVGFSCEQVFLFDEITEVLKLTNDNQVAKN